MYVCTYNIFLTWIANLLKFGLNSLLCAIILVSVQHIILQNDIQVYNVLVFLAFNTNIFEIGSICTYMS